MDSRSSEKSSLLTPPGEADYFDGDGLMENVQQSHRRQKICSAPVSQQSTPNTLAGSITTTSAGILPPARVVAEDLTKANLREGLPNLLQMALSGVGKQVTSESMDSPVQADLVELRTISCHLPSQGHLLHTQVDLAPVVVQQVAAVEIPASQDRRSPIWPCTSPMAMNLLMTCTRLYLLRMLLLFHTFQDRISKGLTMATFYQQKSLSSEGPTITSQVM